MSKEEQYQDYYGGNPNLKNIWGKKFTVIALVIVILFTGLLIYRVMTSPGENFFKEEPAREIQPTK